MRLRPLLLLTATALLAAGCSRRAEPAPPSATPPPAASAPAPPDSAAATASFDPRRDWPAPTGWKSETLPFPLDFAPDLTHRGVEELRFAPGMFDATAPGYWSYAFVWWLEDRAPQDAAAFSRELTDYFRGLLVLVARERAKAPPAGAPAPLPFDAAAIACTLRAEAEPPKSPEPPGWQRFTGEATIFDAFGDNRRLSLHLTLAQRDFPAAGSAPGHRAILVLASPADPAQPIWRQLEQVARSFAPATAGTPPADPGSSSRGTP